MLFRITTRYEDENGKTQDWVRMVNTNRDGFEDVEGETTQEKMKTLMLADAKWYGSWIEREEPGQFPVTSYLESWSFGPKWHYKGYLDCRVGRDDEVFENGEMTAEIYEDGVWNLDDCSESLISER